MGKFTQCSTTYIPVFVSCLHIKPTLFRLAFHIKGCARFEKVSHFLFFFFETKKEGSESHNEMTIIPDCCWPGGWLKSKALINLDPMGTPR